MSPHGGWDLLAVCGVSVRARASPGLAMLRWMAARSFLFHLCISSSILSMRARFRAHRQPLREDPLVLFSTFSKHLFKDRLCRTEFFQPSGAVYGEKWAPRRPLQRPPREPCLSRRTSHSGLERQGTVVAGVNDMSNSTLSWEDKTVSGGDCGKLEGPCPD